MISAIFVFLPVVTIADIPFIGESVSSTLLTMMEYWNGFTATFPYAIHVTQVFLLVIVPFELLMLVSKLFLGSIAIGHHTN